MSTDSQPITKSDHAILAKRHVANAASVITHHLSGLGAASDYPITSEIVVELEGAFADLVLAAEHATLANLPEPLVGEAIQYPPPIPTGSVSETIVYAEKRIVAIDAEVAQLGAERASLTGFLDSLKTAVEDFKAKSGPQLTLLDAAGTAAGPPKRREETEKTIPADWKPDEKQVVSLMADHGLTTDQVERATAVFVGEMTGTGEKKVRWGAVFRSWLSVPGNSAKYKVAAPVAPPVEG